MKPSGFKPRTKPMKSGLKRQISDGEPCLLRATAPAKAELPVARGRCKAKGCRNRFVQLSMKHRACSPDCAIIVREQDKAEEARKTAREDKARKQELQPRSYWVKRAQAAVNAWVRLRDAGQPCISCGTTTADAWHAGHFYSTAARPDLRFDPANVHRQCAQCNLFLSGNLIAYRLNLPARIGQDEVDRLDGPPTAERATVAALKDIETEYRRKARELERQQ